MHLITAGERYQSETFRELRRKKQVEVMVLGGPTLHSGPSCEGADRSQIVPARWWVYFC